jgi:hypothetical protein
MKNAISSRKKPRIKKYKALSSLVKAAPNKDENCYVYFKISC